MRVAVATPPPATRVVLLMSASSSARIAVNTRGRSVTPAEDRKAILVKTLVREGADILAFEGPPATPAVRATWARRAAAEYRSAAIAGEMLHWVISLGVPTQIVALVHEMVADELAHANLSRDVHAAAGGQAAEVVVRRSDLSFGLFTAESLERRALAAAFSEFVVHESIALEAFRAMSSGPLVPAVRRCVRTVIRDEARHRRSGALLFHTLVTQLDEAEWLREWIPVAIQHVAGAYVAGSNVTHDERQWGLLDQPAYDRARHRALSTYVAQQVAKLGLSSGT